MAGRREAAIFAIEYGEHGEYFIGLCGREIRYAPKELVAKTGFQETPGEIDRIAMPIIGRERLKGERARVRSLLSIQTDLAWSVCCDHGYRVIQIEGCRILATHGNRPWIRNRIFLRNLFRIVEG